jgi:DNA-binding CsgD family transcriptional regulator/tetratricopeptide (TPR) repeat protein
MAEDPAHCVIHRADTLVARDREQAQIVDALSRAKSGRTELVLVSGEPGIGKSRLIRGFLHQHSSGATVINAICYEDSATPFSPILSAFRATSQNPPDGWKSAIDRAGLREMLESRVSRPDSQIDQGTGARLVDQFAIAIQELAADTPVVLALDDAQWAAEPDLDLIRYVLRSSARTPILIILSYRDTELTSRHPLQQLIRDATREFMTTRISLSRLDEHSARQLIGNVLGSPAHTVTRHLAQAIQEEAEGVPFFIEELVFHLHETGALTRRGKNWLLDNASSIAIPQSIRAVVGHRLQMLSPEAQETLAIAAVLGNQFTLDFVVQVARRISSVSDEDVGAHLNAALERSLITELRSGRWGIPEQRYTFAHDQIRDVLYGELNAIRRRILHQAAGEALEEHGNPDDPGHYAALALHFGAGEDIERASLYAEQAGDDAANVGASRQAADHYSAALEIHTMRRGASGGTSDSTERELRLLMKRQEVLGQLSDATAQWRDLQRWHELAVSAGDTSHLFMSIDHLARYAIVHGDATAAERYANDMLSIASDDPELQRLAWIRRGEAATGRLIGDPARLYRPPERLQEARAAFEKARSLSSQAHSDLPLILIELGIIDWELAGDSDRETRAAARTLIADALEQFRAREDDRGEITALIALAYRRVVNFPDISGGTPFVSFLEEIRRLRSEERRLIRESDRARNEARAALAVHVHCREFGIPERALERGLDALNWAEAAGDRRIVLYALGGLSQTELTVGRPINALDFAERAMAIVESGTTRVSRERANQWLGVASIAAGHRERGIQCLRDALPGEPDSRITPSDLEAMSLLARALIEQASDDELSEALTLTDRIARATDGMPGSIPWGVEALLIRNALHRHAGNFDQALIEASTAVARHREREIGLWRLNVEVPYRLARSLIDLGRSAEAIEHLTAAANRLHRASEQITDSALRASFLEQVPLHRDVYYLAAEAGVWAGETPKPADQTRPGGLSRREIEVLRLVAIGKTNRDIADELFISEKTVARHLTNIFTKIGTESRTQAAAWAYRNAVA